MRGAGVWLAVGQCVMCQTRQWKRVKAQAALEGAAHPTIPTYSSPTILRAGAVLDRSRIRGQPLRACRYLLTVVTKPSNQRDKQPPLLSSNAVIYVNPWLERKRSGHVLPTNMPTESMASSHPGQAKPNKHNHAILHRSILLRPCSKLARSERPTHPAPCTAA